jgi:tetratricopeptide (TPR) repeat protein
VRARYWNEGLKVFKAHPWLGSGAEGYATARLRYRTETLDVRHAHGYVVQTLADLGVVGLALTLALLACWMAAAGRATHPFNRRWSGWPQLAAWRSGAGRRWPVWRRAALPYSPERIGMLTLLTVVVVFGIHSLVDWTWYVPGDACVALLCAGWLAGRGELAGPAAEPRPPDSGARLAPRATLRFTLPRVGEVRADARAAAIAGAAVLASLLAAWAQWQPQRSVDASQRALALLSKNPGAAEASANAAVARDPLSAQALVTLATVQQTRGRPALARDTLARAVRLQPSNPQTWLALGGFDLAQAQAGSERQARARVALGEIAAAIYLNPELVSPEEVARGNREAITVQNEYVQALRASNPALAVTTATLPPVTRR